MTLERIAARQANFEITKTNDSIAARWDGVRVRIPVAPARLCPLDFCIQAMAPQSWLGER